MFIALVSFLCIKCCVMYITFVSVAICNVCDAFDISTYQVSVIFSANRNYRGYLFPKVLFDMKSFISIWLEYFMTIETTGNYDSWRIICEVFFYIICYSSHVMSRKYIHWMFFVFICLYWYVVIATPGLMWLFTATMAWCDGQSSVQVWGGFMSTCRKTCIYSKY